ncbi:MAG: sugar ABC transporter ATP-binding protein [Acidimicrobiia bacterium]|nr:sugar ABC transporter ATP-binding protein [Actinomycetota bacterium]MBL6925193.1 sugar ABC transporter ATP-binding protein [Acidimicrobiia bacterium]
MALDDHVLLKGISKQFGSTRAIDSVNLTIRRGEVHALIGENGAGKSTLGKVLAGVHEPDEGSMTIAGKTVRFRSPRQALDMRVTMVAQELQLVPTLTAIENVYLGIESSRGPVVDDRDHRDRYQRLVQQSGIGVDPSRRVDSLSVADQQKVEILRALAREAELIVMDEPTARLTADEASNLLQIIRDLSVGGTTVVFVSHFLDQVLDVADRITIMRDGRIVRTSEAGSESTGSLVEAMIGRTLEANFPPKSPPDTTAETVLTVKGLGRVGSFEDVDLQVNAGEIVALAGLVGSGRTEVVRSVFGVDPVDCGSVEMLGSGVGLGTPRAAIASGMGMIPESRSDQGLMLRRPVRENASLPRLGLFSRLGMVLRRGEQESVQVATTEVDLRAASLEMPVESLSGGNQQKTMFARWLIERPRLLIADEPTRGVDVGAKRAIYELLAGLAEDGMAVLLVSSEIEEVLGLAHRILVMRGGRIVCEIDGIEASEAEVLEAAFGTSAEEAVGV